MPAASADVLPTPGLARRLACLAYEGVLLFGITMTVGLLYGLATQQRHALAGKLGLQMLIFGVLGLYFVWFWSRTGQTLAMQTWHVRLVTREGGAVTPWRASVRYLLAWLWFLPALATLHLTGLQGGWPALAVLSTGVLAYAVLAWLHPDRQYWHDAACGTRLVIWQPPPRPAQP